MVGIVKFSVRNRSIHPLEGSSNCSWRVLVGGSKRAIIGHVSMYISATRRGMAKRTPAFDSPRRLSLNTSSNGILIVDGAPASLHQKSGQLRQSGTSSLIAWQPAEIAGNGWYQ